ncbi:E3 ubiquitin-protein ligase RNF26-like [Megalops cyprinoides]|uniref:E3 ubiquitin-protein ligase RNF26-like n=1 Tax=Megalops cyprinoides TaxID=118141 RepID=UPI00186429AE|nr:E3 ubiquitin-protein ligase RNF26-like [Megalops cyprinoides]
MMGLVWFVFGAIGRCMDFVCLMLDLNFCIVNALVQLLLGLIALVHNAPALLAEAARECGNLALLCTLTVTEAVSSAGQGALGGMLESCKMMAHLSSHVMLRTKEQLHRGLLSGHYLLRQVWEGCSISLSLALYLVNTVVNMLLIGLQNCYGVLVGAWEAVLGPLQKAVELGLAVVTFLYSTLVGTSVLLWTPCQLALEFLGSLCHMFASVFLFNSYGLALTTALATAATLYLNSELLQRGARRALPALLCLRRALCSLQLLALQQAQALLETELWQRLGLQRSRTGLWRGAGADTDTRQPAANGEPGALARGVAGGGRQQEVAAPPPSGVPAGDVLPWAPPCCRGPEPTQEQQGSGGTQRPPEDCLLNLLKEHEDRKKCVICQDSSKTVVLLPCRHLCLCRDCTSILLRQPIYQHNCPLCRHMILQTMDVYL